MYKFQLVARPIGRPSPKGQLAAACAVVFLCGLPGTAIMATPLAQFVPDYMEGNLETAIIPTPQQAELKETAFGAGKLFVVRPDRYHAPDTVFGELKRLFGDDSIDVVAAADFSPGRAGTVVFVGRMPQVPNWQAVTDRLGLKELLDEATAKGTDAYVLATAARKLDGKNVILLAGNTPAADFWALATLRQMVFPHDGSRYVREGRILDYPRFTYRGNKRPRQWEWRYKANYAWFFSQSRFRSGIDLKQYHRQAAAWTHHGDPLRATDKEMDQLIAGYQHPEKKRRVAGARDCYDQGCREFILKFDDTSWTLSEATGKRFSTGNAAEDYFKALHYFLVGMHRRIKAIDRANRVFFMPRPYWFNSFEQREFAEALLSHGPLPKDMGLSVCGPEVISWTIPTACLKDYRELYGLEGKAQIYDNFGRGGEYFACTGRDRDLWTEVDCLFPERGTPVTRITVYDYLWNPEAYDPDRSLKLSVRELADRDPQLYKTLWQYISYYNKNRDFASYPTREEVRRKLPETNRWLKSRFDALVPLLERSELASETALKTELWGPEEPRTSYEWGEYARLRRRLEFTPYILSYGYQEAHVIPTPEDVVVDGRLTESAWKAAKSSIAFVQPAWGQKEVPKELDKYELPADEGANIKLLYSKTRLYMAIEFRYQTKPTLPHWAAELWRGKQPGEQVHFAWRVPCIEVFFDVTGHRDHYYHIVSNVAGLWMATHSRTYEKEKTGGWWQPGWDFKFTLQDKTGVFEASIPLDDLTDDPPAKGTIWGFQAYRSKIGPFAIFSGCYDLVGGEPATRQFGRIVFQ